MPIEFDNTQVSNATQCTLSLSPWDCDCVLAPGDATFNVNCVSDSVIDQGTGAVYVWVGNAEVQSTDIAVFTACTPDVITLTIMTPGQKKDAARTVEAARDFKSQTASNP